MSRVILNKPSEGAPGARADELVASDPAYSGELGYCLTYSTLLLQGLSSSFEERALKQDYLQILILTLS